MNLFRAIFLMCGLLPLLAACGGGRSYNGSLQCAPYARQVTGIELRGAAYSWWYAARGKYVRTRMPEKGAILVFKRTSRLPYGHVSIVRKLRDSRTILVEHANWEAQRVDHQVPIIDVSSANDWSMVRVWWAPSHKIGLRQYATYGFIIPGRSW